MLVIRRINSPPNTQVRELCSDGVLKWFGHVESMEKDRIPKSMWECVLVFAQWIVYGRDELILFKGKRFGC